MEQQMTDINKISNFVLAGKAIFTIRSAASGNHWTFKVAAHQKDPVHFVSLMVEPDHYEYLGYIRGGKYLTTSRSCRKPDHAAHQVFRYLFNYISRGRLHDDFEFYHEGICARCGRPLTDPISIQRGLGPTCAKRSL